MIATNSLLCDQYCVCSIGSVGIAVSALSVQEVTNRQPIYQVPASGPLLVGLSHLRNQFIPVVSVAHLLGVPGDDRERPALLVLNSPGGSWACPVDRAWGISPLETAHVRDAGLEEEFHSFLTGTATFRDTVVRVLEADQIYRTVSGLLQQEWQISGTITNPSNRAAGNQNSSPLMTSNR